ncbi:hypothetical protein GJ496_011933 [Pomphorhynchus laevis]|nr:hypothetical protein GJ496_011933 [Pomphorhynchus laevis]
MSQKSNSVIAYVASAITNCPALTITCLKIDPPQLFTNLSNRIHPVSTRSSRPSKQNVEFINQEIKVLVIKILITSLKNGVRNQVASPGKVVDKNDYSENLLDTCRDVNIHTKRHLSHDRILYDGLRGTAHSVHQTQKTSAEINRLRQNPVINKANTFNRKLQNSFNDISTRALDTIIKVNYLNSDNSPLRESPHNSHRYHTNSLHRTLNRSEQRLINQQRLIEKQMSTDIISPAEAYFIESCFSQLKEDQLSNGYTTYQNVLQSNREEAHFQNKTVTALHEQGVDQHIPILRYATYSDILMDDDVFCLEF